MNDLKFALRQLRKSPAFTLIAVVTLALGIGLNTAIFSLINDLFLKGLPFQEPERVLHILTKGKDRTDEFQMSAPRFMLYRDGQTIFSGFAAENQQAATVTGLGDPLSVPIFKATANWFDVLGVRPIMGRTFLPQEEEGADVAIITDRFWKARFAGSQDIIGKTIVLDGVAHTIVGVIANMPVSWTGTPNANIWTTKPMVIPGFSHEKMMRGSTFLRVIGRLKAGVTLDQAKAALGTLEDDYRSQFPEKGDAQFRNIIKTLPEDVTENLRPGFATMLTAVGFVLLIACSNVANLLLVRFSGRRREISLRLALGATRGSVLRLFVFESVLISLLAGVLGAALAWQLVPLGPETDSELSPDRTGKRERALRAGALVHDRAFARDGVRDGFLSGAAKLARRYRRCAQGRRTRHARKCAATAVPENSRGRAGGALGYVAGGRVVAHHEFRAPESAGSRFQRGQTLDRSHGDVAGPISR